MDFKLIDKYKNLSDELIQHIINYTDVIVYRHGKYINRLNKNDKKYEKIQSIPIPIKINSNRFFLRLVNTSLSNKPGYFLEYIIGFYIKINIKFITYEVDGFDRYIEAKSFSQYIFDINDNWSQIKDYSM
jgi:hypothetical protein